MNKRPHPALLGSLIALQVAAWSLNFIFGKVGLRYWTPLTLAAFRIELAMLLMLPVYLVHRRWFRPRAATEQVAAVLLPADPSGRASRSTPRGFWTFVQLGFFGVVVNQVCFTVGLNYTTVGHSALIIGTNPFSILLLAWALGLEAMTLRKVLGMAVAFAGVAALAAEHGLSLRSGTLRGDLITLAGSVGFALYAVLGKRVAAVYDSVSMNAYNYLVGGILLVPLAAHQAAGLNRSGWGAIGWQGWAALGYMAAIASVLAYLVYFWVLRYMAASRLGAFAYLHPLLTTLLGIMLLGEQLTASLLVGGGLVLAGIYLIESGPREDQRKENSGGTQVTFSHEAR